MFLEGRLTHGQRDELTEVRCMLCLYRSASWYIMNKHFLLR